MPFMQLGKTEVGKTTCSDNDLMFSPSQQRRGHTSETKAALGVLRLPALASGTAQDGRCMDRPPFLQIGVGGGTFQILHLLPHPLPGSVLKQFKNAPGSKETCAKRPLQILTVLCKIHHMERLMFQQHHGVSPSTNRLGRLDFFSDVVPGPEKNLPFFYNGTPGMQRKFFSGG